MILRKLAKVVLLDSMGIESNNTLWFDRDSKRIENHYFINAAEYNVLFVEDALFEQEDNTIKFKVLAVPSAIGWVLPMDEEVNFDNIKPITIQHYRNIIIHNECFTDIAMVIKTKDDIHYYLEPYYYKNKMIIFQ